MEKKRYYFDTMGNDDEAYKEAISLAHDLAKSDPEIGRIILLAHAKGSIGWLERAYGHEDVKKMQKGAKLSNCNASIKVESKRTYKNPVGTKDIVITMGLDSDDVFKVDDFCSVKAIIAIPWLKEGLERWISTWGPIEARTATKAPKFSKLDCIVQEAFKSLTRTINMTTGIHHPSDNNRAKTYIRALHKYGEIDGAQVAGFLVSELGWDAKHADEVKALIDRLNEGRYFQGGDKTGLQNHYKRWKEACK